MGEQLIIMFVALGALIWIGTFAFRFLGIHVKPGRIARRATGVSQKGLEDAAVWLIQLPFRFAWSGICVVWKLFFSRPRLQYRQQPQSRRRRRRNRRRNRGAN